MTTGPQLRLVLGDQLNPKHSWFGETRHEVVYVLMEMRQETDYVRHHAQKLLAIFAAMRSFAANLKAAGHRVRYVAINDPSNRQNLTENLAALVHHYRAASVAYQQPDEWRLDAQLTQWAGNAGLTVHAVDSEHFFTTRHEAAEFFAGRKHWLMENFYRVQRRRHMVLMEDARRPAGGQWNFDHDNRKAWPGTPPEPPDTRPQHDHSALWDTLVASGVDHVGKPQSHALRWPLNRTEALAQLDAFITHALPHFGSYQDALSGNAWRLFHSLLSFALNTKMLSPREVVQAAEDAWREGHAPLASTEGFVRQILGWREYVRGVYWNRMPQYTESNALKHTRPLPGWFWTGKTRMACVAQAIGQSLEHAYAHHIQRLMVIGNFALLAGLSPQALHHWYLGIYIDAFEWVEAPNTLGMSQFADGGQLATKPYVSSAAYIKRMGDHCKACHYRAQERAGERACPFNALYWHFLARHEATFRSNPRLAMAWRQWDKTPNDTRQALCQQAEHHLARLESL